MTKMENAKLAIKIFRAIERDLRDRRGIRHEWDRVDRDIQREIRKTNQKIILKFLENKNEKAKKK